jgi:two-component sensor histidine kinase
MVEEGLVSPDKPLRVEISGDSGNLPSPAATSLAVVLTELLQNVMDHAYPAGTLGEGDSPSVGIQMRRTTANLEITVVDNGIGPADGLDVAAARSLGLSIVRGLVDELQGTIEFGPDQPGSERPGTRVSLMIPVLLAVTPDAQRPPMPGGRRVGP